jgi:hypothetical protein
MVFLDKCTDACGYAAAIAAAVCLGSFGVPAKSKVVTRLDADPLVIQTYKSTMAFLTCWLVLLLGEPVKFTSWGIVSGIFWVPGGAAGIYAIRNAGLAIAVGTWSSIIVLTSFFWGIGVFEEHVHSELGACGACLTLVVGLIGMAKYSVPPSKIQENDQRKDSTTDDQTTRVHAANDLNVDINKRSLSRKVTKGKSDTASDDNQTSLSSLSRSAHLEMETLLLPDEYDDVDRVETQEKKKSISIIGEITLTKRQMGILAAIFNGLWGGTVSQVKHSKFMQDLLFCFAMSTHHKLISQYLPELNSSTLCKPRRLWWTDVCHQFFLWVHVNHNFSVGN